jgi:glycosyltransferase involved in cell wall biosynthesis
MLVFPSYREGFPNVPMQAALMDCGLILSNINGCNEIVSNQISGLLVEPNSHKDLMEKMFFARNNQETMNNFSIKAKENIIEKYKQESVWNNLLEEYNKLIYQNGL